MRGRSIPCLHPYMQGEEYMKAQTKAVVASIVVVALALSAISGVTYSWFSDSETSDITVTTGKVDVKMEVSDPNNISGISGSASVGDYNNGKIPISIVNASPGYAVQFTLTLKNESSINIKWILNLLEDSSVSEYVYCKKVDTSSVKFGEWSSVVTPDVKNLGSITVEIGIPESVGNEFQDKEVKLSIELKAYQANAIDSDGIYVYTPDQLIQVANGLVSDQSNYKGKTITIMNDLDMSGKVWPTIILNNNVETLTIKGMNDSITINNLKIDGSGNAGFIASTGSMKKLVIENLTFNNTNVDVADNGTNGIGAIIGYAGTSEVITISDCHVVNSKINGGHWAGGFVGYAAGYSSQNNGPVFEELTISDCSVLNSKVISPGSAGGIIGHATGDSWTNTTISKCIVNDNEITSTGSSNNKAGSVMGTVGAGKTEFGKDGGTFVNDMTISNNIVKSNNEDNNDYIYGRQGTAGGVLKIDGIAQTFPPGRAA